MFTTPPTRLTIFKWWTPLPPVYNAWEAQKLAHIMLPQRLDDFLVIEFMAKHPKYLHQVIICIDSNWIKQIVKSINVLLILRENHILVASSMDSMSWSIGKCWPLIHTSKHEVLSTFTTLHSNLNECVQMRGTPQEKRGAKERRLGDNMRNNYIKYKHYSMTKFSWSNGVE